MKARFGIGPKSSVSEKISDNTLSEGTLVFTDDTHEMVLIDKNKDQIPLDYRIKEDIQVQNLSIGSYKDGDVIPLGTTVEEILKKILQKELVIIESPLLYLQVEASITESTKGNYINETFMQNSYEQYAIDLTVANPTIELTFKEDMKTCIICVPSSHTLDSIYDEYTNDPAYEGLFTIENMTVTINGNETDYKVYWYSSRSAQLSDSLMTVTLNKITE